MEITVTRKLANGVTFQIKLDNERDLKEAIVKATPFIEFSGKCGKCGKENVIIKGRPTKEGFIYIEVFCRDCKAKQPFGEYKEPKGALFLKAWEDAYRKPADGGTGAEKDDEPGEEL